MIESTKEHLVVKNENSSVTIYFHGATITSWIVNSCEKLFLSSKAVVDGSKAIRGGM